MTLQPGWRRSWSETPKTGFLRTRLIYEYIKCLISDTDGPPAKRRDISCAMEDLLGDVYVVGETPAPSPNDIVAEEIRLYIQESSIKLNSSPLKWWKDNATKYPSLARVAKCILNIPGTSVPSESVFSTAGDIVTATRSCLDPEMVDMLIFLKKNLRG